MTHSRSYRLAQIHCSLPTLSGAKATSISQALYTQQFKRNKFSRPPSSVSITQWEYDSHRV